MELVHQKAWTRVQLTWWGHHPAHGAHSLGGWGVARQALHLGLIGGLRGAALGVEGAAGQTSRPPGIRSGYQARVGQAPALLLLLLLLLPHGRLLTCARHFSFSG